MTQENENGDTLSKEALSIARAVATPIYQDAISPAAKEVGKGFETIAKTINVALAPLKTIIWSYDRIEEFLQQKLSRKLKNIPPEKVQTPEAHIAVPAIESLRYTGANPELSDLFINLLATSMNSDLSRYAHPAFVRIINEITSDEARILKAMILRHRTRDETHFPILHIKSYPLGHPEKENPDNGTILHDLEVELDHPLLISSYSENLFRLALAVTVARRPEFEDAYFELRKSMEDSRVLRDRLGLNLHWQSDTIDGCWRMGDLGTQFCNACMPLSLTS